MSELEILCRFKPTIFHEWQPSEWLSLMLVCKAWRDYLCEGNPLAIDWGWHNDTPLRHAASLGHTKRVASLLDNPVVNSAALDNAALMSACKAGHTDAFSLLLNATPLSPTIDLLIVALIRGCPKIGQLLLSSGRLDLSTQPNIDGLEKQKTLARQLNCSVILIIAIEAGDYPEIIKALSPPSSVLPLMLKHRRWLTLDRIIGQSPDLSINQFKAFFMQRLSVPIEEATLCLWIARLSELIGTDIEVWKVCIAELMDAVSEPSGAALLTTQLMKQCPNVSALPANQITELILEATEQGNVDDLSSLVSGISGSLQLTVAQQAFLLATEQKQTECLEWLLELPGVDPSFNNNQPIVAAVKSNHASTVELLLKQVGVASFARDNTPLRIACEMGSISIAQILLHHSPRCYFNTRCLLAAVGGRHSDMIRFIFNHDDTVYPATFDLFEETLSHEETMIALCSAMPKKLAFTDVEELRAVVQLMLLKGESRWLVSVVDSRILLQQEIEQLFYGKHFHQVNRERTDLQKVALPFFKAILGSSTLRVYVRSEMAEKMIFNLKKSEEWNVLIDSALKSYEFCDDSLEAKETFRAHVCDVLCKSTAVNPAIVKIFLKAVNFTTFNRAIQRTQKRIEEWFSTNYPILTPGSQSANIIKE